MDPGVAARRAFACDRNAQPDWADRPSRYVLLSLYWLPVSLFWGMMLGQILPVRVEQFSGAAHKGAYLGLIAMVGALAAAAIQIVIGPISDHWRSAFGRRRPFVALGTLLACAGIVGFGWAHSFPGLVVSFLAVQLFLNVANGPYIAYLPDLTAPSRQGAASAAMGLMQLLGRAGGPLLAGTALAAALQPFSAVQHTSRIAVEIAHAADPVVRRLLGLDIALLLAGAAATAAFLPDRASRSAVGPLQAAAQVLRWRVAEHRNFFRLLVSRGAFNTGFYIALLYLPYYVQDSLHIGADYAAALRNVQMFTIAGALAATFPAGLIADRASKKLVVYATCALCATATTAFALARSLDAAYAMAAVFGAGYGAFCTVDWAFAANLLPAGSPAKYMAIWSLADTLPQVAAPVFGPVADMVNRHLGTGAGWRAAMGAAAVCVASGAVLVTRVAERRAARAGAVNSAPHGDLDPRSATDGAPPAYDGPPDPARRSDGGRGSDDR